MERGLFASIGRMLRTALDALAPTPRSEPVPRFQSDRDPGPCFVEFQVPEPAHLEALARVFEQLKSDKDASSWRPDEEWIAFFGPEALAGFGPWTEEERERWSIPEARTTDEHNDTPDDRELRGWHFFSMIDCLQNGDYALLSCRATGPGCGRIEFEPFGWPFGGVDPLCVLVESFGCRLRRSDDGSGPVTHPRKRL